MDLRYSLHNEAAEPDTGCDGTGADAGAGNDGSSFDCCCNPPSTAAAAVVVVDSIPRAGVEAGNDVRAPADDWRLFSLPPPEVRPPKT